MGNATTVDLVDAGAITVSFDPISVSPANTRWSNDTFSNANTALTNPTIALGFSPSSTQRATDRITVSLAVPDPEMAANVVSGFSAKDISVLRFNADVIVPDTSSQANRADFYAFIKSWISSQEAHDAIVDRKPAW